MSYCETTKTTSFTSTAGEATGAKVAEIISSLSTDLYTLASEETTEEQKQSILSNYPTYTHTDLDGAVDSMSVESAVDDEAPQDLTEALTDIISVSSNTISLQAKTEQQDTSLFEVISSVLLPLMDGAHTKLTYTYDDSREGISTDVVVLYKDGSVKSLDEVLAAA